MLMTIGRVLFALLFIISGVLQLLNFGDTANEIATKVTLPELMSPAAALLAPYVDQLLAATGMTVSQLIAVGVGALQIICGLMIALSFGARFFAILLLIFVVVTTVYVHDFWNQTLVRDRNESIFHILKNLAVVGALFMIIGQKSSAAERADAIYHDRDAI